MNNSKKIFLGLASCVLLQASAYSQVQWSNNLRKTSEVLPANDLFQFAKTNLAFIVLHNADTLQIHIKVSSDRLKKRLLLNGLQVFIDKDGKEDPKFSVVFPSPRVTMPELQAKKYDETHVDEQGIVDHLSLLGASEVKNDKEVIPASIVTNVMLDASKQLVYNITIPLKCFSDSSLLGRNIGIGMLSVIPEEAQPKPMSNDATMNNNTNLLNPYLYSSRTGYPTRSPLYYRSRVRYIPPDEGTNSWIVAKMLMQP